MRDYFPVDLNRNFVLYDLYDPATNPAYGELIGLLNPPRPVGNLGLESLLFLAKTVKGMVWPGQEMIRNATLVGQYCYAKGIYYGGHQRHPET